MKLLEVKDLSLGYEGKTVVDDLSFSVEAGDYLIILGENGAGKSTLMRALLGLIKPQSGSVVFDPSLKKSEIGYLPQQTVVQRDFPATVREIVLSGALFQDPLLREKTALKLQSHSFKVYTHVHLPGDESSVPVGQVYAAGLSADN